MKILFLSRWFPYPPDNGSKIRIFNLLKQLSPHHRLYLISFAGEPVSSDRIAAMQNFCRQVDVVQYRPFRPRGPKAMLGFLSPYPRSVVDTYHPEMDRMVKQALSQNRFDIIVASELDTAPYARAYKTTPKILDELQLTVTYEWFARQHRLLPRLRRWLTWAKLSRYVSGILKDYDGCTTASDQEQRRIRKLAPPDYPARIIPNGVDVSFYAGNGWGEPEDDTLVYSGSLTYYANFEAVDYFLRHIFPLIQARRPGVKLLITGKTNGAALDRLPQHENVIFTGYLDDVRPTIARSRVEVVPLRQGGGTRLKILEALALGTPVVSTGKGAEGLDLTPGRDLLIADRPADFAGAVVRLLQDRSLCQTLRQNGRRAVETRYDWQKIGLLFNDFIEEVVLNSQKAGADNV